MLTGAHSGFHLFVTNKDIRETICCSHFAGFEVCAFSVPRWLGVSDLQWQHDGTYRYLCIRSRQAFVPR
jgi:hypothetical protein